MCVVVRRRRAGAWAEGKREGGRRETGRGGGGGRGGGVGGSALDRARVDGLKDDLGLVLPLREGPRAAGVLLDEEGVARDLVRVRVRVRVTVRVTVSVRVRVRARARIRVRVRAKVRQHLRAVQAADALDLVHVPVWQQRRLDFHALYCTLTGSGRWQQA